MRNLCVTAGIAAIFIATNVWAEVQPRSWGEGIQGLAYVDAAYAHTDNFFFSDTAPQGASGYFVRPTVQVTFGGSATNLELDAKGDYSDYSLPTATESSYLDGLVSGRLDWTAGTRSHVVVDAEFRHAHDPIGTGRQAGLLFTPTEADKWNQTFASARYRFGAADAPINLEISADDRKRHYVSNEGATDILNFHGDQASAAVFYNYSPKTAFLVDYIFSTINYDSNGGLADRDTRESIFRGGVQWKATAKTTGDLRAGYASRTLKANSSRGRSLATWAGSVTWTPGIRTWFGLQAGRTQQESYLAGVTEIDSRSYSASWVQGWGERLSTTVYEEAINATFYRSGSAYRKDNINRLGLKLEYSLVRYLSIIASVDRSFRNSDFANAAFLVNSQYVGIRIIP